MGLILSHAGTHYNYLRDYNPETGRYLTSDPLGQAGGINTYLYANANPLKYTDPLGLAPLQPEDTHQDITNLSYETIKEEGCDTDVYRHIVLHLSLLQQQQTDILYDDSVSPLVKSWFSTPNGGAYQGLTVSVFEPDAKTDQYNLSYQNITADGVQYLGEFFHDATKHTPGTNPARQLLIIDPETSSGHIYGELSQALGRLFTVQDNENLAQAIQLGDGWWHPEGQVTAVDIIPLYEEILTRYQTKLYSDERVIVAENAYLDALDAYQRTKDRYGKPNCSGQGNNNQKPSCKALVEAASLAAKAAEHYGDVLAIVNEELIDAGYMPAMDALDAARRPMRELTAQVFVGALGLFVPLTPTDLAIDAATFGLGKIKRVGKAIDRVVTAAVDLTKLKAGALAQAAKDRVWRVRYGDLLNYEFIAKNPSVMRRVHADKWDEQSLTRLNAQLQDLDAGTATSKNLLASVVENPELLRVWRTHQNDADALKRLDYHLGDKTFKDAVNENPELLVQLGKRKDLRDPPESYLSPQYIANHLARFDEGAIRITTKEAYDEFGTVGPPGGFIMSRSDFERIARETRGDKRALEERLGLDEGTFDGDIIIAAIDRKDIPNLRMASGNEGGAHDLYWRPGGKTSGGVNEAVADIANPKMPYQQIEILGDGKISVSSNVDDILRKIPEADYADIVRRSAHNVDSDTLVLGKYRPIVVDGVEDWSVPGPDSYVAIARSENATYFDLGAEWDSISKAYDLSGPDMFRAFNVPVLDNAVMSGKQIKFTHDPRADAGYLGQEWEYLISAHGFSRLESIDGVWYAR